MLKPIKCIVAGRNADGEPDLYFVIVEATEEQIENGEHYDAANANAYNNGYEPFLVYDEECSAGRAMLPLFAWESATVIAC